MYNTNSPNFILDTGACLRGAAACRRDGQGYMPCPPSMAGRIEVAEGDRNLRGNAGKQRRSRCFCLSVEGGQDAGSGDKIQPAEADRSGSRLISRTGAHGNLFRADSRMNEHTHGWPGRSGRGEQAKHIVPNTSRHTVPGMESSADGLSVPAPHPFPKAPVPLKGSGSKGRSKGQRVQLATLKGASRNSEKRNCVFFLGDFSLSTAACVHSHRGLSL